MSGDGSIYRRDERTWVAQLSIGSRTSRRYVRRNARTRADARAALEELRAEHRAGVKRSRLTTGDYLEQWVADVRNIRPSTRHGYAAAIAYHLQPSIGHVRLSDLSPLDVEGMLTRLAPRMSPKMLANVHAVLRRALTHAARVGLVTRNVAGRDFVDAPSVKLGEPDALSRDEVTALLTGAKGDRLEALFVTAIGTGLRQGELLGLSWQDIEIGGANGYPADDPRGDGSREAVRPHNRSDRAGAVRSLRPGDDPSAVRGAHGASAVRQHAARLTVRHELARVDGRYVLADPKTPRSRRSVPLAPPVVAALLAHRERMIAEGFVPTSTGPVFVNTAGGPLNGSWVTHRLYQLLERAGVRRVAFKALRATAATRWMEAGAPEVVVAALLGHTRTATTKRHYLSVAPEQMAEAVERVG